MTKTFDEKMDEIKDGMINARRIDPNCFNDILKRLFDHTELLESESTEKH